MKILIVGGGGREHALAWKLARDSAKPDLFCAPGNAGTADLGQNLAIGAEDVAGLLAWARKERPALTVVGPEAPLCAGLVDAFSAEGLRVFGPTASAARLEGSKVFAKDVLRRAGVPTAAARSFQDPAQALEYVRLTPAPLVVKADGLAAGKGVSICRTNAEAEAAVREAMLDRAFGAAGASVLIEEFLEGEEISVLAFVDGQRVELLPSAQDHKRAFDLDQGPNTGGMGAYSPAPAATEAVLGQVLDRVFMPTLRELNSRGIVYKGVLYAGLMITADGPKVLEFNCRFGDPETQAVLPRLASDLIPVMNACIDGDLTSGLVRVRSNACVCVVMAAGGYPGRYAKGDVIEGLDRAGAMEGVVVFHAGTRIETDRVVTAGGRVLGVTAMGPDLQSAVARAYEAVGVISFRAAHWRRDIAARGLARVKERI